MTDNKADDSKDFIIATLKDVSEFLSGGPVPFLKEDVDYIIKELEK